jgi:hypothetical protein
VGTGFVVHWQCRRSGRGRLQLQRPERMNDEFDDPNRE